MNRMEKQKNTKKIMNPLNKGETIPKKRELLMLKKESGLLYLFAVKPWQSYTERA